ncbi:MAG: hypothetical protein LBN92_05600 [Treponema sp.]|jgi:sugar (pentulose or hexulose) kinase|nr:hypothetical protein [Treponema sp.]
MKVPAPKNDPVLLCGDLGTSSLKAALIGGEGTLLRAERVPYRGNAPWCWEDAFFRAAASLLADGGKRPAALVLSGNGPTLVPLLRGGKALAPLSWFSGPDAAHGISSLFLPKIAAFRREQREAYEQTVLFLSAHGWLCHRLGAPPLMTLPQSAYEKYYWDEEQAAALEIDTARLPRKIVMGRITGAVTVDGPLKGVPIVPAGPDFIMALIGTGTLEEGRCCDRAGSSEGINVCINGLQAEHISAVAERFTSASAERVGAAAPLRVLPHVIEGSWNAAALISESGKLLAGCARGAGMTSGVLLDKTFSGNHEGGRKLIETLARRLTAALDQLEQAGLPVTTLTLSGGQSRSPQWNQFKADRTGRTLLVPEIADAELLGGAIVGVLALEEKSPTAAALREKAAAMVRIASRYTPRTDGA